MPAPVLAVRVLVLLAVLAGAVSGPLWGQRRQEGEKDPLGPQKQAFSMGAQLQTNGIGLEAQYWHRLNETAWEWGIRTSLASLKDAREVRIPSNFSEDVGRAFIYDKKNYAYTLALTGNLQRVVVPLTAFSRLSLRVGAGLGPNLVFTKPYYIEYYNFAGGSNSPTVIEPFDATKHDRRYVVGQADWFRGFGEIQVGLGLRVQAHAVLNLSAMNLFVRALTLGLHADLFTQPVEIMDTPADRSVFVAGSVGFLLGNAWN